MDEPFPAEIAVLRREVDDLDVGEPAIEAVVRRGRSRRRASRIRVAAIGSFCVMALVASLYGLSGLWEGRGSEPEPAHVPSPSLPADTGLNPESVAHREVESLIRRAIPPFSIPTHFHRGIESGFPFRLHHGDHVVNMPAFWSVDGSAGQTIAWFLNHGPQGMRVVGHGSSANGGTTNLAYRDPPTWAYRAASLSIYVEPTDLKSSLVWAYAHARWIPVRPVSVRVPRSISSATILAYRDNPSNVIDALRLGNDAWQLEGPLNALPVDGRTSLGCPADNGLRIRIRFDPGSAAPEFTLWPACGEVAVTRNGETQPILCLEGHLPALLTHLGLTAAQ